MEKLHGELIQMAWLKYLTDPTDSTLFVLTTEVRFNYISTIRPKSSNNILNVQSKSNYRIFRAT